MEERGLGPEGQSAGGGVVTDELTAEERAELLREWGMYPPDFDVEQKLLRCYDAALARLQSAEDEMRRLGYDVEPVFCFRDDGTPSHTSKVGDLCWDTIENKRRTFAFIKDAGEKTKAALARAEAAERLALSYEIRTATAESRLADATALLSAVEAISSSHALPESAEWRLERIRNLLSRTPAPAAPLGIRDFDASEYLFPAPAAESEPDPATLAQGLDWFRARIADLERELAATQSEEYRLAARENQLEGELAAAREEAKRNHDDSWTQGTRADEAEDRNDQLKEVLTVWQATAGEATVHCEVLKVQRDTLRAAIDAAVVELESHALPLCSEHGEIEHAVSEALSHLRAAQKAAT